MKFKNSSYPEVKFLAKLLDYSAKTSGVYVQPWLRPGADDSSVLASPSKYYIVGVGHSFFCGGQKMFSF